MNPWNVTLPSDKVLRFESKGGESGHVHHGYVRGDGFPDKKLKEEAGDNVEVVATDADRVILFEALVRKDGNVVRSDINIEPIGPDAWLLRMEDAVDRDFNDWIVRVHIDDQ